MGEAFGHWFNDFVANRYIKKHHGVFVPEVRLWPNYLAVAFMIPGLVLAGQALQFKWSYGVIVIGWGMYVFGVMICSVCTTAYILDCYPNAAGEVMGFMNLARVMVTHLKKVVNSRVDSQLDIINNNGAPIKGSMYRSGYKLLLLRRVCLLWSCFRFSERKSVIRQALSNLDGKIVKE